MSRRSNPQNRLSRPNSVSQTCNNAISSVLRNLPLEWIHRHRDVQLAEEKAKNGEGADEDDKDIGDQGDQAGFPVGTVVVHQGTAYQHYEWLPNVASPPLLAPLALTVIILVVAIHFPYQSQSTQSFIAPLLHL